MGTITTTSNTAPFQYPGSRLVAKLNGQSRWVALVKASTADNYVFYASTDGGGTWAVLRTIVRANVTDVGSIYTDNYGWLYWAYRTNETGSDRIMVRRIETATGSNKPDTGEMELGSLANSGTPGSAISGMDVTTHYNTSNGYHYVVVAHGLISGSQVGLSIVAANIDPSGTISNGTYRFSGTRTWMATGATGRHGVSIDKEHNGDGYDGGASPNLWATFGRDFIRVVKIPWSGDGWTGSPGTTLVKAGTSARDSQSSLWDGQRLLMVVPDPTITDRVLLYERNRANTATVTRQSPAHPGGGVVRQATMAYDYTTGNVRIFAVATTSAVLYSVDYVRATDTWGAWVAVTGSPVPIGANADNYGAKISTYQDARHGIYIATGTTPFTLQYLTQTVSYPPDTPTWVSPPNNAAADVGTSLALDWAFTDTDPGDTQSAYAISRQIGAGALAYWRASDSTWQPAEVQNSASTTIVTLASGWAAATDANYVFKVKVWDTTPTASAYSAGLVIIPSTPVNPVITAPTAAQVLTTDHVTMTWTAAEQTQFRVILNVTSGAQVYDSGWITDSASRSYLIPYTLANGSNWTITFATKNLEGLPSANVTRQFTVSYVPPMTPTLVATPSPANGWIAVAITNPTPGGGAPVVSGQELWRRVVGDTSNGVRVGANLASGATLNDWRAVGGVAYEYRVIVTGVNGTSTTGAWTQ